MSEKNRKPVKKFMAGGIHAAIWENQRKRNDGEEYQEYTVSVDKRYKDQNGEWQSTDSFRVSDIPKATLVLSLAYEQLVMKSDDEGRGENDD